MQIGIHPIAVSLYLTDLTEFALVNKVYVEHFGLMPPVRVCIEIPKVNNQKSIKLAIKAISDKVLD